MLTSSAKTSFDRRLKASAIVVLACLAPIIVLMEWPRGDARFVGEWTTAHGEKPPSGRLVLRRNGTGSLLTGDDSNRDELIVWRIEDDAIVFGHKPNWLMRTINHCWRWARPNYFPLLPHEKYYPILEMSSDEIRIADTWHAITLRRIH